MKKVVRKIDLALKSLYQLDSQFKAEDFLLTRPIEGVSVGSSTLKGALYIQSKEKNDLSLGIYLNKAICEKLASFPKGNAATWSTGVLEAFTVATEEISHFHYLLHHARTGRQVSQLELELQGEIDKFLVTYFTNADGDRQANFDKLFERLFHHFRLSRGLSEEQKERYTEANRLAKRFIRRQAHPLTQPNLELTLRRLRRFYRLNASEKISHIADLSSHHF